MHWSLNLKLIIARFASLEIQNFITFYYPRLFGIFFLVFLYLILNKYLELFDQYFGLNFDEMDLFSYAACLSFFIIHFWKCYLLPIIQALFNPDNWEPQLSFYQCFNIFLFTNLIPYYFLKLEIQYLYLIYRFINVCKISTFISFL